ncbi:jouberin-like [Hydractinia symbiolongicarpus]|uniref:jouberin-like n=1 Tax=Hydractinia symbiolongicarpus TaxID=13093 RepID=UPI00254B7328|nr:jouberin-like [Hydractinia symbiolongicarpus]
MEAEESETSLLKKKNKEAKKLNAARERTHARFEALLNVGSGSEDISEATPKKSKKKERTRTADAALVKPKRNSLTKKRSRSQENLLKTENDTDISSAADMTRKTSRKQKDIQNNETSTITKKKKKRAKQAVPSGGTADGTENDAYEDQSLADSATVNTADDEMSQAKNDMANLAKKKMRKKKRQQKMSTADRIIHALEKKHYDDGLLLCIIIHKADQLRPDSRVHHPVIRVHVVNMETGQYIKKTSSTRNVTSIFESKNEKVDYVLPMMTKPFDFMKNRSFTPYWEETLIYNDVYSYFLQREEHDPPVIVFFELLDFMQMNLKRKEFVKTDKGWYRIAWAFLKLVSPTGSTNTDKKCRLQFYQPITRVRVQKEDNAAIEIFQWWKYGTRVKYSSTLYVTVKGVLPPQDMNPATRSMFPLQEERGDMTFEELNKSLEAPVSSDHESSNQMWTKLPGQVNRIPNKMEAALPTAKKGCSTVRFSNDGRYLACACSTNDAFPILIYEFPDGKLLCSFTSHFGLVYDLCWSMNGKELLSASADSTVRCWDTKRFSTAAIKVFPHPSYVYTCKYHLKHQALVLTGSYDRTIRIWNKISDSVHGILLRELSGHRGYVNTMALSPDGTRFFSGDSAGLVIEWSCFTEKKKRSEISEVVNRWKNVKNIELEELKGTAISTLLVHPGQMKLLIHSKDSLIRMFDLRSYGVLKTYVGGVNFKEHIHACFSVCGTFIFCGTENGFVHVWNTETGDHVFTYKDLNIIKAVADIHFHPHDNFIAFCCYGNGEPVVIYSYDPKVHLDLKSPTIKSTDAKSFDTQKSLEETTELYNSMRMSSTITNDAKRMERVQKKLQSVTTRSMDDLTTTATKNRVTFRDLSPLSHEASPRVDPKQTMLSTWGSDFTYTAPLSPALIPNSPHSQQHLGASGRFFGRSSSIPSSPLPTYDHSQSINMRLQDETLTYSQLRSSTKPVFTFNQPQKIKSSPSLEKKKVVSLYEYKPNRADELALQPNDLITVLYEDNENWWMGQLQDGRQGYFPVNYVMEADESYSKKSSLPTKKKNVTHSAAVDKHGDFKIISGTESDTAVDVKRARKKRHQRREANKKEEDGNESVC